jgi:hypothetical protein
MRGFFAFGKLRVRMTRELVLEIGAVKSGEKG